MTESPTLSILVICRNYERYVTECLRSILDTADQGIELVFLDNGSKDRSADVAREVLRGAPKHVSANVIALSPEQPLCRALNIAHLQMRGEFFKLISADDKFGPNFFPAFRELVQASDPDVGVWLAGSVFIDDSNTVVSQHYSPIAFGSPADGPPQPLRERGVLNRPDAPPHSTASIFYRRQVWLDLGGFDERFKYEDRPFLFEVLKRGWTVLVHPYNNTYYRTHTSGITKDSAWMVEARLPIMVDHALRSEWRNKPLALYHLARNVRDVAKHRFLKWKAQR
jgi:alpha-1,3-rhamnosyltransferase